MAILRYCVSSFRSKCNLWRDIATRSSCLRWCSSNGVDPCYAPDHDGRTIARVINKKGVKDKILVDSVASMGIRLTNGFVLIGPCILFPQGVLSWDVKDIDDVHENSLSLFSLLYPKLELLIFGYGDTGDLKREHSAKVIGFCRKNDINFEIMPSEKACATFNFLSHEGRIVAAAVLPAHKLTIAEVTEADLKRFKSEQYILPER